MDQDLIPVPATWWQQIWFVPFRVEPHLPGLPWPRGAQVHVIQHRTYIAPPGHRGPHQQFFYTLAGCGCCRIDGCTYDLPPGTGLLYDTRDANVTVSMPANATQPWMWLRFAWEYAEMAMAAIIARHGPRFHLAPDAAAVTLVQSLRAQRGSEPILGVGAAAELVARFLALLADDLSGVGARSDGCARRARRIIDAQLERGITIKRTAALVGVSPEHLARAFSRDLGESPSAYLRRVRLERAMRLLADPRENVDRIAQRLGYASASHFARAFRAGTGCSPGRWRSEGRDLT